MKFDPKGGRFICIRGIFDGDFNFANFFSIIELKWLPILLGTVEVSCAFPGQSSKLYVCQFIFLVFKLPNFMSAKCTIPMVHG